MSISINDLNELKEKRASYVYVTLNGKKSDPFDNVDMAIGYCQTWGEKNKPYIVHNHDFSEVYAIILNGVMFEKVQ